MKVIRLNLLRALKEKNLTLTKVGIIAGITRQAILHILNGRNNPSWKTQQALVSYFKIPSEQLFSKDKSETTNYSITRNGK